MTTITTAKISFLDLINFVLSILSMNSFMSNKYAHKGIMTQPVTIAYESRKERSTSRMELKRLEILKKVDVLKNSSITYF